MARLLSLLAILLFALTAAVPQTHAQTTDARDYEGAGGAPNNTVVLLNYIRHTTTNDRRNLTTNLAIFRASWVKKFGAEAGGDGQGDAALRAELRRLREENKRLLMEREILKKATVFFAKHES